MVGTRSTRYLHCVSAIVRKRDKPAPRKVQYVKPAINVETSFLVAATRVIPVQWTEPRNEQMQGLVRANMKWL